MFERITADDPLIDDPLKPIARFQRFEKVRVVAHRWDQTLIGREGTVIWCDPAWRNRRTGVWSEWIYCVAWSEATGYRSFVESDLVTLGAMDDPANHRGVRAEISFDCVETEDSCHEEGCFRLPGQFWGVFVVEKQAVPALEYEVETWRSGVEGVHVLVPSDTRVDEAFLLGAMAQACSVESWAVVWGPNSMVLK